MSYEKKFYNVSITRLIKLSYYFTNLLLYLDLIDAMLQADIAISIC